MNAPTTMMTRLTPCVSSQWPSSARIPPRLVDAEPVERQRDRRERRDAVGEQRQRARQLLGARVDGGAVLGADDVERVERAMDDGVRDADDDGGDDERRATIAAIVG